jgi:mRNA interferase MazF
VAGRLNRGDVHLFQFGKPDKQRPVVILTRDGVLGHLSTATIAPMTSSIRGVPSEVLLDDSDGMKGPCAINLHNVSTVVQGTLGPRVGRLSERRMGEVCAALRFSLGCG